MACLLAKQLVNEATDDAKLKYPGEVHRDNDADAYRHCLGSCWMTQNPGYRCAKLIGDNHENGETNPDNLMDLHNNGIGRAIGMSGADCQKGCAEALKNGRLVNKPRTYSTTPPSPGEYYPEYEYKEYGCNYVTSPGRIF